MLVAEPFYDAVMAALGVTKMGSGKTWISYGERCDADHPERTYLLIRSGPVPEEAYGRLGVSRRNLGNRLTPFGMPGFLQEDWTKARRVFVPNIIHTIMGLFSATQTATVSKPFAIDVSSKAAKRNCIYHTPNVALWHKCEVQRCPLFGRYQGKSERRGHLVFVDAEIIRGGPLLEVAGRGREAWRAAPGPARLL